MNRLENPYESPNAKSEIPEISNNQVESILKICQIITAALAMGLLTFTAFALYSIYQKNGAINWTFSTLVLVGLGLSVTSIPASFLFPKFIASSTAGQQADSSSESRIQGLLSQFQSQLIVGLALLEGTGFLNAFALMQDHHPASLLAGILCIAMMLVRIPTRSKLRYWLHERLQG